VTTINVEHLPPAKPGKALQPETGTYALILQSHALTTIQVGRWREMEIQPGYYIYVGSAFGPGGVRARLSRHLREDKPKRWHIDYLRASVTPLAAWVSYQQERLEHRWALAFYHMSEASAIQGFGCSDCNCYSHLFHVNRILDVSWPNTTNSVYWYSFD
jgi:Uri superfamily endonuclease